jgi:hypothetical protein
MPTIGKAVETRARIEVPCIGGAVVSMLDMTLPLSFATRAFWHEKISLNVIADTGLTSVRNLNLAVRWSLDHLSASIRLRPRVQVAYRMRALGPERAKKLPRSGFGAEAQGLEMPVTLARLLVLVFALSCGCGLLRGLISRRQRGGSKPLMPTGRCDSAGVPLSPMLDG